VTLHKKDNTEAQAFTAFYGGMSGKNGQEEKLEIEEKPDAQDIYPTNSPSFSLLNPYQKSPPLMSPSTNKIVPRKTTSLKWIIQIYSKPSLSLLKSNGQNHACHPPHPSHLPHPSPQ
jgi:hypothetical protein